MDLGFNQKRLNRSSSLSDQGEPRAEAGFHFFALLAIWARIAGGLSFPDAGGSSFPDAGGSSYPDAGGSSVPEHASSRYISTSSAIWQSSESFSLSNSSAPIVYKKSLTSSLGTGSPPVTSSNHPLAISASSGVQSGSSSHTRFRTPRR